MAGKSERGVRGFVTAEGAPLDDEVHLRINSEVLASLAALRGPKLSVPDVVRAAIREYVLRHKENR